MKSRSTVGATPRGRLLTSNAVRVQTFYRELLGLAPEEELRLPFHLRDAVASAAEATATGARQLSRLPRKTSRVHLHVGPRLEQALAVAWERGGRVVEAGRRTELGLWRALITDPEGNLVVLYSREAPLSLEPSAASGEPAAP